MSLIRSGRIAAAALAALLACAVTAPALAAPAAKSHEDAPVRAIAIAVNGEALQRDPAPRIVGGRLLVPVVRIYSALGISVARDGNTLIASAPSQRITLRVGSARATVDARTVVMDSPAVEIDGATYVPLRFVADSLGAQVSYDSKAERVEVISTAVGRTPGLEQQGTGGESQLIGEVSAVDLNSAPETVTVTRGVAERTIAVTSEANIVVQDVVTHTEVAATLNDVRPGDAIAIGVRHNGRVDRVTVRYASRAGTIAATSNSQFVLTNGYVVTPDRGTLITLNNVTATLADLKVGDSVTVRLNPDTGEKRQLIVARPIASTPGPAGAAQITDITTTATRPLRAGDAFTVTLHGSPAGRATFDIGTYVTAIPLSESPPGTYTARYVIPPGVNFGRTSVYGRLNVSGSEAPRAEAPQLVSVTTTPPQIPEIAPSNGTTVGNNRPSIYATFASPTDAGINTSTARIEVNGLDVTAAATRTGTFITYMPALPLADGRVDVVVSVADNAGNTATRRFTFTVRSH